MDITLYGKVDGHELKENCFVSFEWEGIYEEEPTTYDCPGSWSWDCHQVTNAKFYGDDYLCKKGRDATEEEIEELKDYVTNWEPQEVFDRCDNDLEGCH